MNNTLRWLSGTLRAFRRNPRFAVTVIVVLALGIGANAATLGLLYQNLFAPLPYAKAGQLVTISFKTPDSRTIRGISASIYRAYRTQAPALENASLYRWSGFNLSRSGGPIRVTGIMTTSSLFSTLGVQPSLGRLFSEAGEQQGAQPVIVLSYAMWNEMLHRDSRVIGQTLTLNDRAYTVIGVMPKGFWFPSRRAMFWTPVTLTAQDYALHNLGTLNYDFIGRLSPGVSLSQLAAQTTVAFNRAIAEDPDAGDRKFFQSLHWRTSPEPWRTLLVGNFHQSLLLMQVATGLLILLVWFNLANLFMTRALARRSELVLRRVLGANAKTLFLQLLRESLALCAIGAFAGLLLGRLLIALFEYSGWASASLSVPARVWPLSIGIAAVLGLLSALVFSVTGFHFTRRQDLSQALREGDAHASSGRDERHMRSGLAILQVALACSLCGMGLLLARSLANLNAVNLGFQPQQVISFQLSLPPSQYSRSSAVVALDKLHSKLAALPGVSSVSIASLLPFAGHRNMSTFYPLPLARDTHSTLFTTIADGSYFKTLSIPVLAGHSFTGLDTSKTEGVALIDILAAKELFGTTQALGREISFAGNIQSGSLFRVIGIVATIHHENVGQMPDSGSVYLDRNQDYWFTQNDWSVAVRTPLPLARFLPLLHDAVAETLPTVPMYDVGRLDQRLASHLAPRRSLFLIVAFFSLSALLLAAVGLYAVQSYAVSQRRCEFGIRAALGADSPRLLRLVLSEAGRLLVIGLIVGLAGMAAIAEAFVSALYGVSPTDPVVMLIVAAVIAAAMMLVVWIPAWRASRIEPAQALKQQ